LGIYEGKGGLWGEGASPPLLNLTPKRGEVVKIYAKDRQKQEF